METELSSKPKSSLTCVSFWKYFRRCAKAYDDIGNICILKERVECILVQTVTIEASTAMLSLKKTRQ